MAGPFFRLFLAFLCFSHAIPITRSRSLLVDISQEHNVLENTHMANMEKRLEVEERIRRVLEAEAEINDYPGSGANNRHTPRPQLGRGCVEC
ncbi:PREDICTED: uncharacterized protein LOC109224662 [Nicotiana attenuata]|uniref:Uncharacterized protein n=1 Tax=Nicotiana attenuata TaxID=49451 RepID=A0A1J6IJV0_NICAT|nr:PREDICTED: uncharacterized protein LOC109224662 [Nicotiana attenuata]OIT05002.1 hypothetical protein A4A49_16819 [Nicotiana attenuata]